MICHISDCFIPAGLFFLQSIWANDKNWSGNKTKRLSKMQSIYRDNIQSISITIPHVWHHLPIYPVFSGRARVRRRKRIKISMDKASKAWEAHGWDQTEGPWWTLKLLLKGGPVIPTKYIHVYKYNICIYILYIYIMIYIHHITSHYITLHYITVHNIT